MTEATKPAVDAATLRRLLADGAQVTLVDVRSGEEFATGHVEGSVNVPPDRFAAVLDELPRNAQIVTVCNLGGARSSEAAARLRDLGFAEAKPLTGGVKGWRNAGD